MKKILFALLLAFSTPALAGQEIDVCNGCKIYYQQPRKVVKKVPVPVAVPVAPAIQVPTYVPVGVMPAGPGPISSTMQVPVYAPVAPVVVAPPMPRQSCAWYVDPYDLFGQLFGDPDLVQSCVYY